MNTTDAEILKASVGKTLKITTYDGETLMAKVVLVSEEDADLIYELILTNRESQYEKFDEQPAYRIGFNEIEGVELLQAG
ncbi:MAG: hypothetical protein JSS69_19000 [Acidobacteria bacterium]|nr:hypothetical protein [Acidobacteriota bacterium]MBS1868005.1 hypothetical protein [Acidobacteriota bacterium]